MKPSPELVLNQAFAKIAMEMGPALPAGYGQGSATTTGVVLLLVAQEFNRAAAVRLSENKAMRELFGAQAALVTGDLGGALRAEAAGLDEDMTVSALEVSNGRLKKLLIRLHEHAETTANAALDQRIVLMMQGWAGARQVFLPAM